ncbi:hypothetical protein [Antrihabitans cavernicola]|uniref:Autophagy-related protein 2 n=1 Tax=Antrihabitans cavernicola TaxID=2495913 RepID=A0A5A7S564_9NOCA|nr:hypothetical protein [Spelaeibacter cavernicola]KAA0017368.1 hypothetical protein FOY51_25035 [Spelaeibacter cavernicola]
MAEQENDVQRSATAGAERDDALAKTLDDIEERVTEERKDEGKPGNVDDRAETEQIDSADQAPE